MIGKPFTSMWFCCIIGLDKKEAQQMGLDISVLRCPRTIDLGRVYAVRDAIDENFDWYLGNDNSGRLAKYKELKEFAKGLDKMKVLKAVLAKERTELHKYLSEIEDGEFADCISWVIASIQPHEDGNTHLFFDYEKLPGREIVYSCSWGLRGNLYKCALANKDDNPNGDGVVELDVDAVKNLAREWHKMGFKIKFAKWVGFFLPNAGGRILDDCMKDLGMEDMCHDARELLYFRREIEKVANEVGESDRLWLVSSY